MKHIGSTVAVVCIVFSAFSFGWVARGNSIYGGMFKNTVQVMAVSPEKK